MFIIIPAKPFHQSKTRLAPVLSVEQRVNLSRYLLQRTVRLAGLVGQVVVVSRDSEVRRLAKQMGAWALVESGQDLNRALRQAGEWIAARQEGALLVIPADLPRLSLVDLTEIAALGQRSPAVVLAPCHRADGTNALLMRPPNLFEFNYGANSFEKHQQAARAAGIEPTIYRSSTVALDLDYPEDLEKTSLNPAAWKPACEHRPR